MSTIISFSINKNKIEFNDKGYANLTMFVEDETNSYGQNVTVIKEQTKEEREAKSARLYSGNGKVVWTNGVVNVADKVEKQVTASEQSTAGRETPDLPF